MGHLSSSESMKRGTIKNLLPLAKCTANNVSFPPALPCYAGITPREVKWKMMAYLDC